MKNSVDNLLLYLLIFFSTQKTLYEWDTITEKVIAFFYGSLNHFLPFSLEMI